MKATMRWLVLAVLVSGACDFDIADPNNPAPLGNNPTRAAVAAAATGLLVSSRVNYADWVLDVGILGREAYRFDGSDPRFISELLEAPNLDAGSIAFGGDHWFEQYRSIRSAFTLLNVIGTASQLSAAEQNAVRGFAETIQALDFLMVVNGHTQDSIPVDVNRDPVTDPPAPFVANDSAFRFISGRLDSAAAHLGAGGGAFPFSLSTGFTDFGTFSTPATFLQFNRALKARVEVYRASRATDAACGAGGATCYNAALTALTGSFVDTTAPLDRGVYHAYGTRSGDLANPLFQNPQTGENLVHPSLEDSAETKPGGGLDDRFTSKTVGRPTSSTGTPPLSSDLGWIRYAAPDASIPIIRNEELILLRAEANNALGNAVDAEDDINAIRVRSGGLDPCGSGVAACPDLSTGTQAQRLGEILRQRWYSLLYEGGHRWIDMRRTGRFGDIPIDRPGTDRDPPHATYPIPRDEVLARQP